MGYDIIISGFGGQGLMSLGKIIAEAALSEGKHVTWFPSYGAEMRGGTAHCFVKISAFPIASPLINFSDVAIMLNKPSLVKFKKRFKPSSLVIINSDLVQKIPPLPKSLKKISLPLNAAAFACGSLRAANSVVLGLLVCLCPGMIKEASVRSVLGKAFAKKEDLACNIKGFSQGKAMVSGAVPVYKS